VLATSNRAGTHAVGNIKPHGCAQSLGSGPGGAAGQAVQQFPVAGLPAARSRSIASRASATSCVAMATRGTRPASSSTIPRKTGPRIERRIGRIVPLSFDHADENSRFPSPQAIAAAPPPATGNRTAYPCAGALGRDGCLPGCIGHVVGQRVEVQADVTIDGQRHHRIEPIRVTLQAGNLIDS